MHNMQLNFFCFIRFRIYIDPHKYFFAHTLHVYLIHLLIPHNNCFLQFRQIYASVLWIWLEKAGQLHRDPQLTLDPQISFVSTLTVSVLDFGTFLFFAKPPLFLNQI